MHGLDGIRRINSEQVRREKTFAKLRKAGRLPPVVRHIPVCCGSQQGNRRTVLAPANSIGLGFFGRI